MIKVILILSCFDNKCQINETAFKNNHYFLNINHICASNYILIASDFIINGSFLFI